VIGENGSLLMEDKLPLNAHPPSSLYIAQLQNGKDFRLPAAAHQTAMTARLV
jgi:hypothetical protein